MAVLSVPPEQRQRLHPTGRRQATALVDLDGTLVDTNYLHVLAWSRAFRKEGIQLPQWRIHSCVGMGGDQLVPELVGEEVDAEKGESLREGWEREFERLWQDVAPLPGARELLLELRRRGHRVIVASSAKQRHLDFFLTVLDAHGLVDDATTAADVNATKPHPAIVQVALAKAGGDSTGVMIGDSPYDCLSAEGAGVPTIALLTGGFSEAELRAAGAIAVYPSLDELRLHLDATPLGGS